MLVALEMEVPAGTPLFAKVEAVEQAHTPEQHPSSPRIETREICRSVLATPESHQATLSPPLPVVHSLLIQTKAPLGSLS